MVLNSNSVCLQDEDATVSFGHNLAQCLEGYGVITLSGDLGTGKTTLSRGLMRAYGHQGAVKSPTYTLLEPYELENIQVMHFDLYRMGDPEELEFLGIRDFLNDETLCLIEWPEKGQSFLPPVDLAITLSKENNGRKVSWHSQTEYGDRINAKLNNLFKQ